MSALIVVGVLVGACGDSSTNTTGEIADRSGPPFGVAAAAREFEFIPDSWTVPSSALLVLDFDNQGTVEHFLVVIADRAVVPSAAGLDDAQVYRSLRAPAGERASDTFLAPAVAGSYQVICIVPGHLEAGMTAVLTVED